MQGPHCKLRTKCFVLGLIKAQAQSAQAINEEWKMRFHNLEDFEDFNSDKFETQTTKIMGESSKTFERYPLYEKL